MQRKGFLDLVGRLGPERADEVLDVLA